MCNRRARRRGFRSSSASPRHSAGNHQCLGGFWSGVQIAGVRIPSKGAILLKRARFRRSLPADPAFHRQLAIRKMVLDSPKVIWAQNAEGKWVLPAPAGQGPQENAAPAKCPARRRNRPRHPARAAFEGSWIALRINNGSSNCWTRSKNRIALPPTWRCATRSIPRVSGRDHRGQAHRLQDASRSMK